MSSSIKISSKYCWYNNGSIIVKVFFVNGIPFTFDELPDGHLYDLDLVEIANSNESYEMEDLYKSSSYLIEEEAHPMLFSVELDNPQDLPDFEYIDYDGV
jgi:hypothetical protein